MEINYLGSKYTEKPKLGDTVTVHYTSGNHIYRADPDNIATMIEVKGAKKDQTNNEIESNHSVSLIDAL